MSVLPTKSFAAIVQSIAAGVQGRASALINFAIGSTLRAIAEAFAAVSMWQQALILQVLGMTRASTSQGADLDRWVADFGVARLGSQSASGLVTFARFSAGTSAPFIPVGSTIKTADGSQTFSVYADPTNTHYSAMLGGYTMPVGVTSLTVPVIASVPGSGGNIVAGSLTQPTTPLTGIDTVTNSAGFTNGVDQESDQALRARFVSYILGLSRGDAYGLAYAIESLAVNVQYTLTEDYNYDGTYHPGFFYVVADDGSGAPSGTFLAAVTAAVQSVRPLGIFAAVFAPAIVTANVSFQITTAAGYDHGTVLSQVVAAMGANINGLGLGNGLPFSVLSSWVYAVPGVINVKSMLLNGVSGDGASIAASPKNTIKLGTVTVS
jgi:uncharacterized phage protein gp47/JayE